MLKQLAASVILQPERLAFVLASSVPPLRSGPKRRWYSFLMTPSRLLNSEPGFVEAFGVELEQPLKRRSCIQISQHIGGAANPGSRADGNRKQRGSAAHRPTVGRIRTAFCNSPAPEKHNDVQSVRFTA